VVNKREFRTGRWISQDLACRTEVDDRYVQVGTAIDRTINGAKTFGEIPSQVGGTVAR
jgi:hypothetical protein